jgi:nuclear transport factor 2 (NTF2) superfamily protein
MTSRPPLPPFTLETARQKVRLAEDAWNTRDPERVALAGAKPASTTCRSAQQSAFCTGPPDRARLTIPA